MTSLFSGGALWEIKLAWCPEVTDGTFLYAQAREVMLFKVIDDEIVFFLPAGP